MRVGRIFRAFISRPLFQRSLVKYQLGRWMMSTGSLFRRLPSLLTFFLVKKVSPARKVRFDLRLCPRTKATEKTVSPSGELLLFAEKEVAKKSRAKPIARSKGRVLIRKMNE